MIRERTGMRRLASVALGVLVLTFASRALADKVLVLPFSPATSAARKTDIEAARQATRTASQKRGHALPSDAEVLSAGSAVKDGVADTSDEYRAAGRASNSAWTLSGRVDSRAAGGYRLELEVCQVGSGRVESLAREIDPARAEAQTGEMLALLLRPEGVANAEIPWAATRDAAPTPAAAPPQAPPPGPVAEAPAPAVTAPPAPAARSRAYAQGHPFALGAGLEVASALARPTGALGTPTSVLLHGALGYAIESVRGFELRADVAGAIAGPRALWIDVGARQAFMVVPTAGLYLGPELALGAFIPLGGTDARFLARGAGVVGLALGERLQLEATGDLAWAPGAGGSILLAGGGARVWLRF